LFAIHWEERELSLAQAIDEEEEEQRQENNEKWFCTMLMFFLSRVCVCVVEKERVLFCFELFWFVSC
jgi:hypothetical protein